MVQCITLHKIQSYRWFQAKTMLYVALFWLLNGVQAAQVSLEMPDARPGSNDDYLCSAFNVSGMLDLDHIFVTSFKPSRAQANRAHHMLLYFCDRPSGKEGEIWDCRHHRLCEGKASILFAWAKNAPGTSLPRDVSFGVDVHNAFMVLQVHYVHPLDEPDRTGVTLTYQTTPTRYSAAIYLLARSWIAIPGLVETFHGDVNCAVKTSSPLHIFAFRVHAHQLGTVITGYKFDEKSDSFTEIAKGNPQWPQAFYSVDKEAVIEDGDILAARCTYNSSTKNRITNIGATNNDEMCNLYLMYYTEKRDAQFHTCFNEEVRLDTDLPEDSDKPLEHDQKKEMQAIGLAGVAEVERQDSQVTLRMSGALPTKPDSYLCTAFNIAELTQNEIMYIKNIKTQSKSHHVILEKCDDIENDQVGPIFECPHHKTCRTEPKVLYVWAKDAEEIKLPNEVGFQLDPREGFLVLQVHYERELDEPDYSGVTLELVEDKPKYMAGVMLLHRTNLLIPAHTSPVFGDVNCKANSAMTVFAFRPHAHKLATRITGHVVNARGDFRQILDADPSSLPDTFYDTQEKIDLDKDDYVAARCTFDASKIDHNTKIGSGEEDEMCNVYLMYYTSAPAIFRTCANEETPSLSNFYPDNEEDQDNFDYSKADFVPRKVKKQENGYNPPVMWVPHQPLYPPQYLPTNYGRPVLYDNGYNDKVDAMRRLEMEENDDKEEFDDNEEEEQEVLVPKQPSYRDFQAVIDELLDEPSSDRGPKQLSSTSLSVQKSWPPSKVANNLGQVAGVSIDIYGNVVIFHRGDRVWNRQSFRADNVFTEKSAIPVDVVLTLNMSNGNVINSFGRNKFFLPHMITVDKANHVWATDVGLHQIFRFAPYGGDDGEPLLQLGTPMAPGGDNSHFCKPTSVAVSSDLSSFFVADGYCNSRVIQYSLKIDSNKHHIVNKVRQWGMPNRAVFGSAQMDAFNIPHSLTLIESKNLICVADRENGRIQCFDTQNGKFVRSIKSNQFGNTIYAVTHDNQQRLVAVGGPEPFGIVTGNEVKGYVIDVDSGDVVDTFGNGFLNSPHDVAVGRDGDLGDVVLVAEINPRRIVKFADANRLKNVKNVNNDNNDNNDNIGNKEQDKTLQTTTRPKTKPESATNTSALLLHKANWFVPESSFGVGAAFGSISLTCLLSICLCIRRCRKRGRGKLRASRDASGRSGAREGRKMNGSSKKSGQKLGLSDLLGKKRNNDGFRPLKQDDDDFDDNVSSDSDDLEHFSLPAMRA